MNFTECCNLRFIGDNHSPIQPDGYCLHCGFHPEIERLKKENEELKEDIKKLLNVREILRSKSVSMRAFAIIDRVFNPIKDKWLKGEV